METEMSNVCLTNKSPTQCERIVKYINDFGSITQLEAFSELGVFRLASRMHEISKNGYNVVSETIKSNNRYGEPIHYSRYTIIKNN